MGWIREFSYKFGSDWRTGNKEAGNNYVIKFLRFYMIFELGQNVLYKTFNLEFKFMRFDRYAALTIFLFIFQVEEIEEGK